MPLALLPVDVSARRPAMPRTRRLRTTPRPVRSAPQPSPAWRGSLGPCLCPSRLRGATDQSAAVLSGGAAPSAGAESEPPASGRLYRGHGDASASGTGAAAPPNSAALRAFESVLPHAALRERSNQFPLASTSPRVSHIPLTHIPLTASDAPVAYFGLGALTHTRVDLQWSTGEHSVIEGDLPAGAKYSVHRQPPNREP